MPTYEYACDACGNDFEVFQKMSDAPVESCPKCGKKVRRVLSGGAIGETLRSETLPAVQKAAPSCTSTLPRIDRRSSMCRAAKVVKSATSTRRFAFFARIGLASSCRAGAITASRNVEVRAVAVSASSGRFRPTIPPNADSGSASRARTYASAIVPPVATPHGLVCLMIAQAVSLNSETSDQAASRSIRLLKDSSLP